MRSPIPVLIFALAISVTATLQPIPRTESALSPTSALPLLPTSTLSTPSSLTPQITEAPDVSVEGIELQEKWHLTTYTTCVTLGSYIGCGVHEPVLPGGDEIAGAEGRRVRGWMAVLGAVGVGLLLR